MGNLHRTSAAAAAVLLCLAGCAPATVGTTSHATDYNGKPQRLYVLGGSGMGWGSAFSTAFAAKFRDVARKCGVASVYDEVSGLELDASALTARMRAFQPDTVLTINHGGGVVSAYGNRVSIDYGTTLTDVRQNRAVWKGKYTFSRGGTAIPIEERAAVLAIDITNSLKKDGLLTGCAQIALGQNGRLDPAEMPRAGAASTGAPGTPPGTPARKLPAPPPAPANGATLQDLKDLLPAQ